MRDDEEGLQKFRRLDLADAEVRSSARAPFFSAPMNGTIDEQRRGTAAAPPSEKRRARSRGIIEMRIITGIDTAIHIDLAVEIMNSSLTRTEPPE